MYCMLVFLLTQVVLCKLCSEADVMCEQDTRIRLVLVLIRTSFTMCASMPSNDLFGIMPNLDFIVIMIRPGICIDVDDCVLTAPKGK